MQNLEEYRRKRNFQRTPEPAGAEKRAARSAKDTSPEGGLYVIQKHAARRLHYDLRLEIDGVFKSWAVPKGPSLTPGEKRLAVHVEDHPLEYGDFEGVIPDREYGGGTVMLWDRGLWAPITDGKSARGRHRKDEERIDFVLAGEKLRGAWTLVRSTGRSREGDNWLLIKRHDNAAGESELTDLSVTTGRTMKQIAADRDRTWSPRSGEIPSDRAADDDSATQIPVPDPAALAGARKKSLPDKPQASLATLVPQAPAGEDWLHEIKFDGYRILARWDGSSLRLISRNGKDWTRRFAATAALLKRLACKDALLDGEIVAMTPDGTTSFRALQEALAAKDTRCLVYHLFDLLHLDGYDLTKVPLTERKQTLEQLLAASGFTGSAEIRFTEYLLGQGPEFAEQACRLGLEGIICKRAQGVYRSGRTRDWLKVKCTGLDELLICGYTDPGGARKGFGALLLGGWRDRELVYAGRVGTGFSERVLTELSAQLRELEIDESPFAIPPNERGLHWVRPQLVAEVEFSEWTRDGVLRHPSFRGLREDREPKDIQLPEGAFQGAANKAGPRTGPRSPATQDKVAPQDQAARLDKTAPQEKKRPAVRRRMRDTAEVAGVKLTNAGRILYPELGITKLALAQYYEEIEHWALPQLAHRPLSLVRCPNGYLKDCFFQKHPRSTVDKAVPRIMIDEKEGPSPYVYIRTLSDIIALVQVGALELHLWGSTVDDVEHPDQLVFDLDPAPDVPLSETLRVARELRDRLAGLNLESFPRTTGGKGLHLVVPVIPEHGWEQVKAFCHEVAKAQARADPRRVTSTMAKSRRRGRIFIDYLRNGRGATAIGSYSTRARPSAPVAVPVAWDEVTEVLRPDRYNLENLHRRLGSLKEDPWQGFEAARRPLSTEVMGSLE